MSEADQRRLVLLFCQRCKEQKRTDVEQSFKWRVSLDEIAKTKAVFVQNGFIDEEWNLIHWDKRQFLSDSSTERTRRYRERKRTSPERHDVTDVTKRDGLDQIQIRSEQKQNRGRSDRDLTPLVSIFSKVPTKPPALPKNRNEMVAAGYAFSNTRPCQICGEELQWFTSPKGGSIPVLAESGAVHLGNCAKIAKANS
jgi:hypothetical protein